MMVEHPHRAILSTGIALHLMTAIITNASTISLSPLVQKELCTRFSAGELASPLVGKAVLAAGRCAVQAEWDRHMAVHLLDTS